MPTDQLPPRWLQRYSEKHSATSPEKIEKLVAVREQRRTAAVAVAESHFCPTVTLPRTLTAQVIGTTAGARAACPEASSIHAVLTLSFDDAFDGWISDRFEGCRPGNGYQLLLKCVEIGDGICTFLGSARPEGQSLSTGGGTTLLEAVTDPLYLLFRTNLPGDGSEASCGCGSDPSKTTCRVEWEVTY